MYTWHPENLQRGTRYNVLLQNGDLLTHYEGMFVRLQRDGSRLKVLFTNKSSKMLDSFYVSEIKEIEPYKKE